MYMTSSAKILLLLNFLQENKLTKQEITKKFEENGIRIGTRTLNYYLSKLKKYSKIEIETKNKISYYYAKRNRPQFKISKQEKLSLISIKNLLKLEKNYKLIKETVRLLLKISLYIEDFEQRNDFLYLDYYTRLNWYIIKELEKHCEEKNIIKLDYVLPNGGNRHVIIHADEICQSTTSQRLYLKGFLDSSDHFSIIPIDRIFRIENVIREKVRYEKIIELSTYVTSKEKLKELEKDDSERVYGKKNGRIVIKRPFDDKFYISQRLFNLCPDLYYISDNDVRETVKEKLENMRELYERELDF